MFSVLQVPFHHQSVAEDFARVDRTAWGRAHVRRRWDGRINKTGLTRLYVSTHKWIDDEQSWVDNAVRAWECRQIVRAVKEGEGREQERVDE
jgi:hypothetical protein